MQQQQDLELLGREAEAALTAKFRSINNAAIQLRTDRAVLTRLTKGLPPRLDILERIGRGVDADLARWRGLAGYDGVGEEATGAEILMAGIKALATELGRPIRIAFDETTKARITPDEAEQTLAVYRQQATDGLI